jgi:hypothetical protein
MISVADLIGSAVMDWREISVLSVRDAVYALLAGMLVVALLGAIFFVHPM